MRVDGASGGFAAGQSIGAISEISFSLTLRMEGNKQCELQAEN